MEALSSDTRDKAKEAVAPAPAAFPAGETALAHERPGVLSFKQNLPLKNAGLGRRAWDVTRTVAEDKYSVFRLFCYSFADYFSPAVKKLQTLYQNKLESHFAPDSKKPYIAGEGMPFIVSAPQGYSKKRFLFAETFDPVRTVGDHKGWYEKQIDTNASIDSQTKTGGLEGMFAWFRKKTGIDSDLEINLNYDRAKHNSYIDAAKLLMSRIEGVVFALLTTVYFVSELRTAKSNMAAAVGAELGKDPEKVSLFNIASSKNPFIVSEKNRLILQTATSYVSDASFLYSIKAGLLGAAVKTTIMRTRLNNDNAPYEVFKSMIGRIEKRHGQMTDSAQQAFVDEVSDVMQAVRKEQGLPIIQHDALNKLRPVYDHLVRAVAGGEVDQQGALYFLGCCLDEHRPDQSMHNLHALINHGPEGVAKARQQKLDLSKPSKIKSVNETSADAAVEQTYSDGRNAAIKKIVQQGASAISPASLLARSGEAATAQR